MNGRTITVCGVMRQLGLDLASREGKRIVWTAGRLVRDKWFKAHGDRPDVRLTAKSNGSGSHDKAHYPEAWRDIIVEAIRDAEITVGTAMPERQVSLFGGAS